MSDQEKDEHDVSLLSSRVSGVRHQKFSKFSMSGCGLTLTDMMNFNATVAHLWSLWLENCSKLLVYLVQARRYVKMLVQVNRHHWDYQSYIWGPSGFNAVHVAWCTTLSTLWHVAWCTMLSTLWYCCACCLVYYAVYTMVLLCMLPGVLCCLHYGVAVHVAWCTMLSTLWYCCACCLVSYTVYTMVLLCMLPGVLCCLHYGQSLQPYGFIRNFYGNDLSITEYGNRLNFTEVGKIFDMGVLVVLQPRRSAGGKFKVSWKLPVGITASSKGAECPLQVVHERF